FASRQNKLEVVGLTAPSLPKRLSPKTIYVTSGQPLLICDFIHDKYWSAQWLKEIIDAEADRIKLLAYVPTFDHVVLPTEPCHPAWPNLVIKLSQLDRGEAVFFGRFRTREKAQRALRSLSSASVKHLKTRLYPKVLFQSFIKPEVLNNRARCIRLH